MEKRTSRGLGIGGRTCINSVYAGRRGFELGPDLSGGDLGGRGPGKSLETGSWRAMIGFVQTPTPFQLLDKDRAWPHPDSTKIFSIFTFLYPVPAE